MKDEISLDKKADIWLSHSNKLWRTVYATPLTSIAVIAGWYALMRGQQIEMGFLILVLGMASMGIQYMVLSRMAQYDAAFFTDIRAHLPTIETPKHFLSGKQMAQAVPVLLMVLYVLLMILTVSTPTGFLLENSNV